MSTQISPSTVPKDRNILYVVIYLIIASLGWIIPPIGAITPEGMKLLGVFVAVIFGWSITSHVWPSFITFILLPFTGLLDLQGLITAGWGSDTFLFMTLSFVVIAYLEHSGVSSFIAAWLLNRKMLSGHPWRLIFMLFMIGWILSSFVNVFAGVLLTWTIVYKICDILGYKPFDPFANLMVFGVAVMGALSLSTVPWGGNALVILAAFTQITGLQVNMIHYLCYSLPFGLCSILGFMTLCRFLFRLDVSRLKGLSVDFLDPKDLVMTKERKIAMTGIGIMIIMLVLPSILPKTWAITTLLVQMGLTSKALIVFFVLSLIKLDNKPVFDFAYLATKGVPWNMVAMTMVILSFVALLGNPATGISTFLSQILTPIFADVSVIWFFLIALLITIVLTNFMINMVVAVIMMAATLPVAASLGISPEQVAYLLTVSCTIAFMLPAASAASCILFANTQWVRAKDVYKYAFPTIIVIAAIALVINLLLFSVT